MKFRKIGTNSILEPMDKRVEASFLARPELYEPLDRAAETDGDTDDHLSGLDIEALKAYAAEHNIDIGRSTSLSGIAAKIREAEADGTKS